MKTRPPGIAAIEEHSRALGFTMASMDETGALLSALAASKPGGTLLELGTGTGLSACWLLHGMDAAARLTTVDTDERVQKVARDVLGHDPRLTFVLEDGAAHLKSVAPGSVDLLFADAWPGKFEALDAALAALKPGGLYVIDDLLPQPNWPGGHQANVDRLMAELDTREDLVFVRQDWASGLGIAVKRA